MNGAYFAGPDVFALRSEMSKLLDDFFGTPQYSRRAAFPALNAWETAGEYWVEAELPGLTMNDLELFIRGNELSIKGRRAEERPGGNTALHRQERGNGDFHRMLELPAEVDAKAVEATLKNGILTVKIPKAESAKPRKITVKG